MNSKLAELRDKLEALCKEYSETHGILVLILDDNTGEFAISGNMCPVCASEDLQNSILANNITHNIERKVH